MHKSKLQTNTTAASLSHLRFCREKELFAICTELGADLAFSLSSLRKDRLDCRLGGIPYRRQGGTVLYCPIEVLEFISNLPTIQGRSNNQKSAIKTKPSKEESVSAQRAGISVGELREIRGSKNNG